MTDTTHDPHDRHSIHSHARRIELSPDAHALIEYALTSTLAREEELTAVLTASDATYVESAEDAARVNTMRTLVEVVAKARTIYVEF